MVRASHWAALDDLLPKLRRYWPALQAGCGIKFPPVFGSWARRDQTEDSDLDL